MPDISEAVVVALIAAVPATLASFAALRSSAATGRKVERARSALDVVSHEMRPNSGGSLRDAIDRLEAGQAALGSAIVVQGRDVGGLREEMRDVRREVADTRQDVVHSIEEHTDIRRDIAAGLREHDAIRKEVRSTVRKELREALAARMAARRSTDGGNVD